MRVGQEHTDDSKTGCTEFEFALTDFDVKSGVLLSGMSFEAVASLILILVRNLPLAYLV